MAITASGAYKGKFITITFSGSSTLTAYDPLADTNIPAEIRNYGMLKIRQIIFTPSAATDSITITETSGGLQIVKMFANTNQAGNVIETTHEFDETQGWMRPVLSAATLSTAANATLTFELR